MLTSPNGQVGHELERLLPAIGETIALDRERLDLAKPADLRRTIREIRPQIIVNAGAYTAVDRAESDEAAAQAVNADAPRVMAEEAKKIGALLVHYSTDYVFDGMKRSPYIETDPANPLGVYGKTKLAGEQAIRETGAPHLIFRTSWVYATRGRNFLLTILRLASEREELKVVRDQIGAPTWSREIARGTTSVLASLLTDGHEITCAAGVNETYHMTADGTTSWHGFASAIIAEASNSSGEMPWIAAVTQGRQLVARRVVPITTEEYPTPARRPAYSVLSNAKLNAAFGVRLGEWHERLHWAFLDM